MIIYVVPLLKAEKLIIEMEGSDTIGYLLNKVKEATGTDVSVFGSSIILVWAGLNLSDISRREMTLADVNMQKESTVYVVTSARIGDFFLKLLLLPRNR